MFLPSLVLDRRDLAEGLKVARNLPVAVGELYRTLSAVVEEPLHSRHIVVDHLGLRYCCKGYYFESSDLGIGRGSLGLTLWSLNVCGSSDTDGDVLLIGFALLPASKMTQRFLVCFLVCLIQYVEQEWQSEPLNVRQPQAGSAAADTGDIPDRAP